MVKIRNFTICGGAIRVTAYLSEDEKPRYSVEFSAQYDKDDMTSEEFKAFKQALQDDTKWDGVANDSLFDAFERMWGEEECSTEEW